MCKVSGQFVPRVNIPQLAVFNCIFESNYLHVLFDVVEIQNLMFKLTLLRATNLDQDPLACLILAHS